MFGIGQNKVVVGLDVGSYAVKAVALATNKDRLTLQGYAEARIDKQDVGEVIRKVIDQLGFKPRRLCTAVSGRSVIVRQIEAPRLEGPALNAHIHHEADKYIPFGSEEVIIDAQPLPEPEGKKSDNLQVMLVAVRRSFIQEHLALLQQSGVMPEAVDVDVFALSNCYETLGPAAPPETERKATALIDIGAAKSNIAITQGARVLFTREVYLAGNEISEAIGRTLGAEAEDVDRLKLAPGDSLDQILDAAQPAFEDLANEIRLSFDYVEGQFDIEVSTVVLSGGSAQLANAGAILGNLLGRPVHVFDPLAGLDLVPSKYDIHTLDTNSPSLAVALGLALHLLDFPQKGLGGSQSHAWQPRSGRGGDVNAAPAPVPPEAAPVLGGQAYGNGTDGTAATIITQAPEPVAPAPSPTPALAPPSVLPPPSATPSPLFATPAGGIAAPPLAATVTVGPPLMTPPPSVPLEAAAPVKNASESFLASDANRSGLLVVLDDDQDIPPLASERIAKGGAGSGSGTGRVALKIDAFSEEDAGLELPEPKQTPGTGTQSKLPDLPPLSKP